MRKIEKKIKTWFDGKLFRVDNLKNKKEKETKAQQWFSWKIFVMTELRVMDEASFFILLLMIMMLVTERLSFRDNDI